MRRKERVLRALTMNNPDQLPLVYFYGDRSNSDIIMIDIVDHFGGENEDRSEWGFGWERMDGTMGQPLSKMLIDLDEVDDIVVPEIDEERRLRRVSGAMAKYGNDRFYIASLVLSGFTIMTALRGFHETLLDLYTDPERLGVLADKVFGFEESLIRLTPKYRFDAIAFFDDWGMQENMIISPGIWRSFFKERYRRQFDLIHDLGMKVYFHCCGYFPEIIPDFIEIGVDFLNISQPNLYDFRWIGAEFSGKVCFVCPVSYQTTSVNGGRDDIFGDVQELIESLDARRGGLVGYLEEYETIGVTRENYDACEEAFRTLGDFSR